MHEKSLFNDGRASFDPSDFEGSVKKKVLDPEQALMLAVLRSAVEDFHEYVHARNGSEKKLFHEAEEWILETDTHWVFSFENICEFLQLEPEYIRRGLQSWNLARPVVTLPMRREATAASSIFRSFRQRHYCRSRPRRGQVIDLQALKQNMERARPKKKPAAAQKKRNSAS